MDARRFDLLSRSLATPDSRRATRRGLAAGLLAAGVGSLGSSPATAKKNGKQGKKCHKLKQTCTGTTTDNNCCNDLRCSGTPCKPGQRCCRQGGMSCASPCDCCGVDAVCVGGKCCIGVGGGCFFSGPCCPGLVCKGFICEE